MSLEFIVHDKGIYSYCLLKQRKNKILSTLFLCLLKVTQVNSKHVIYQKGKEIFAVSVYVMSAGLLSQSHEYLLKLKWNITARPPADLCLIRLRSFLSYANTLISHVHQCLFFQCRPFSIYSIFLSKAFRTLFQGKLSASASTNSMLLYF